MVQFGANSGDLFLRANKYLFELWKLSQIWLHLVFCFDVAIVLLYFSEPLFQNPKVVLPDILDLWNVFAHKNRVEKKTDLIKRQDEYLQANIFKNLIIERL